MKKIECDFCDEDAVYQKNGKDYCENCAIETIVLDVKYYGFEELKY